MNYSSNYSDPFGAAVGIGFVAVYVIAMIISLAISIFIIICLMKVFKKAGEPAWAAWVPFYNMYVMYKISVGNGLWFLLIFASGIPVVNLFALVVAVLMNIRLCQNFGKGIGFGILAIFFPYVTMPILAFSGAEYEGDYCYLFSRK